MNRRYYSIILPLLLLMLAVPAHAAQTGQDLAASYDAMKPALVILFTILVLLIVGCVILTMLTNRSRRRSAAQIVILIAAYVTTVITLVCVLVCLNQYRNLGQQLDATEPSTGVTEGPTSGSETQTPTQEPTVLPTEPPTEPQPTLGVSSTSQSNPANWNVKWDIIVNESITGSYNRGETITFGDPTKQPYFSLPGIATFRGDNYRTGAAYGTANIVSKTLTQVWERQISSLPKGSSSGAWTGSGWTGQPLMVQWDEQTKQNMNLYPEKKAKQDLVEVIYATLDGNIYFYDLADGSYTRDPLYIGMAFKGAGALDPRGYPIMYVGSGDLTKGGKSPRMYIINLIDCSIMYERGNSEPLSLRSWKAFDSSPLVDAETDTLIWPGETGILYTIKLNSSYDKTAGTVSINPEKPVMTRYSNNLGTTIGYESSAVIVENYIYISDNGGMLFCVDLNTMKLQWAQNVKDDTNATPVFEWGEDGQGYLYTATSMENANGSIYIAKLNASTGEYIWEKEFKDVYYSASVSGGVLGSPVLGKAGTNMEGMIIYPIARTPGAYNGILVALDTDSGEIMWKKSMNHYAWSSPVAVYTDAGVGYVIICDSNGLVQLLDPSNGKTLHSISIGSNVEASPAVFNDMLVVGTRGQRVYGIKIG